MRNIEPSTNVPKDTDREFFNAVLNGTATQNYINDYIQYSLNNNRLEELATLFMVKSISGGGFSGGWVEMDSGGKIYVNGTPASYTQNELHRLSAMANKLAALLKQSQQQNEPTTDNIKVLPIDFDISDIALSKYLDNVFGVITPDEYMATTPDGRYYTAYNIKENSPFENKSQCLYKLCKIRQLTRELKQTPDPLKREKLKNEREKLYAEYCNIIKPTTTQPTTAIPQPTPATTNLILSPRLKQALKNAVTARFVRFENNTYRWRNKNENGGKLYPYQYAYYFAKQAEDKGIGTIQQIGKLLSIPSLQSYSKRLSDDGKETDEREKNIKRQIRRFFD